jgi:predicted membrane protein
MLEIKTPIPTMTYFLLFGLFALCIPLFNIYVIIQIKRSHFKRKWLKYIAVVLLNVPTISYAAINGLSFKLLHFQFLLGVGFHYMGYLNSVWAFGIPFGGLYWFWKLKRKKNIVEPKTSAEPINTNNK